MGSFMTSPLKVSGQLHDVTLFNFSLDGAELLGSVPHPLKPVIYKGRAWISTVSVHLKKMRPAFWPLASGVGYHHLAYRVLVDYPTEMGLKRGIYFLESFSNRPWLVGLGNLFTEYAFTHAQLDEGVEEGKKTLQCRAGSQELKAEWGPGPGEVSKEGVLDNVKEGMALVGPLTRAFSVSKKGEVSEVSISRERWPLEAVACSHFSTNAFKTAQFELALRVADPIHYTWARAKPA